MTNVECEAAVFADAIAKAARIAPTKGEAFDKAQGIMMQVRPGTSAPLRVRSTDLQASYFQKVTTLDSEGDAVDWHIPTHMLAGVAGNLPVSSGKSVKIFEKDGMVHFHAGRTKSKLRPLIMSDYPTKISDPFNPGDMNIVDDMASRIQQVAWAVDRDRTPLTGIHIDGEWLVATDTHKLARVPCRIPVDRPITMPMGSLVTLLRSLGPVRVSATKDRFRMMLDDETQVTTTIYQEAYPDVAHLMDNLSIQDGVLVSREELTDAINSMLVMVRNERYPMLYLDFHSGEVTLRLEADKRAGDMEKTLDATGGSTFAIKCHPNALASALGGSTLAQVKLAWGPTDKNPMLITDEGGYECLVMPIVRP